MCRQNIYIRKNKYTQKTFPSSSLEFLIYCCWLYIIRSRGEEGCTHPKARKQKPRTTAWSPFSPSTSMWVPGIKLKSSSGFPGKSWPAEPYLRLSYVEFFVCLFVSLGKTQLLRMPCPCLGLSLHFVFLTSFCPSDASSSVPFWGILSALLPGRWISARAVTVWNYTPICRTHSHLLPGESKSAEGPASFQVINNTDARCFVFKQSIFVCLFFLVCLFYTISVPCKSQQYI